MNEKPKDKMNSINTWFLIEIFSFYGYVFSAVILATRNSVFSTLGLRKRDDIVNEISDLRSYG